jgi:integrase
VESQALTVVCPNCGKDRIVKSGVRRTTIGEMQRFVCKDCSHRFSEHVTSLNINLDNTSNSQQKQNPCKELELLAALDQNGVSAGTTDSQTIKGLMVSYEFQMQKDGLAKSTILNNYQKIKRLSKIADINDPESVKEALFNIELKQNSKANYSNVYTSFLKYLGKTWKAPKYQYQQPIPFIPLESEIDQLIAGCGKHTSTILQTLKETGMRIGECLRLKWIDLNPENNTLTLNDTEKHGIPRMFKISPKLIGMLQSMPKKAEQIFGTAQICHKLGNFKAQRLRLAKKLENPRLAKITFHTLRHWKGTMEYHRTHDPDHVKRLLGHRSLKSTEIYINMEQAIFSESDQKYHSAIASTIQEAQLLVEQGFDYVTTFDGKQLFRKRQ